MATNRDGAAVPVVTTAGQYSYLGKLVVTFDPEGNLVSVDEKVSGPIRIALADGPNRVRIDCDLKISVVDKIDEELKVLNDPIASNEVALDGRRTEVRFVETNQGNLMADALLWQVYRLAADYGTLTPDVAIQNGGGIRNDLVIPIGEIRELDTFDIAPFANFVTVVEGVTRSQFKQVLENAVSRAVDGDVDGGTGRFAQVSGFSFEWSETGNAQVFDAFGSVKTTGTRIQKVVLDSGEVIVGGGRVVPGAPLTVATIDFLARGGDEYPFQGAPFTVLGVSYQQALANYIQFSAGLGGIITAEDYPEGGEGRIERLP
jgi:5'-nucleotidase